MNNLIPQLPSPQVSTISQYSNEQSKIQANNTHLIRDNQSEDPFRATTSDQQRIERNKREAMMDAYETMDEHLQRRTILDAALDTVFGHPPVVDPSVYQSTKQFWDALLVLADMGKGKRKFSITEAIYTVENAYFKNKLSKDQFTDAIKSRAELAKKTMKREHLDANNNLAKNYAIQKQFEQAQKFTTASGKVITMPKLEYDFHDFMGDTNHTQMLVSKLLATGKGQCHSMPLLYLAIAEQLDAQAYLSLAPEHSFIKFSDDDGSMYNYETTSGNIMSDNWMMQSGYVTTTAIMNKIYLDTLSQNQLLALCINDLAMGYISDNGFDGFAETALMYSFPLNPNGIQQNIILSRFWEAKAKFAEQYYHTKTKEEFEQNAVTSAMYRNVQNSYNVIDGLGYQKMPKEAYAAWLRTVNRERSKQDQQTLQRYLLNKSKITTTKNN